MFSYSPFRPTYAVGEEVIHGVKYNHGVKTAPTSMASKPGYNAKKHGFINLDPETDDDISPPKLGFFSTFMTRQDSDPSRHVSQYFAAKQVAPGGSAAAASTNNIAHHFGVPAQFSQGLGLSARSMNQQPSQCFTFALPHSNLYPRSHEVPIDSAEETLMDFDEPLGELHEFRGPNDPQTETFQHQGHTYTRHTPLSKCVMSCTGLGVKRGAEHFSTERVKFTTTPYGAGELDGNTEPSKRRALGANKLEQYRALPTDPNAQNPFHYPRKYRFGKSTAIRAGRTLQSAANATRTWWGKFSFNPFAVPEPIEPLCFDDENCDFVAHNEDAKKDSDDYDMLDDYLMEVTT